MDKFVGIPFVDRGRTFDGCDCWGLICILYYEIYNIILPDYPISSNDTDSVSKEMGNGVKSGRWVSAKTPYQMGDIVAMAMSPKHLTSINHVGFCLDGNTFVHSIQNQRSAICRLDDIYWKHRIKGAYKWLG